MNFKPIASSSKGNCYILESPGVPSLLIEAGIPVRRIREALGFNLSSIAGALITHEHGDHAKSVKDLLKAGVDVWTSVETSEALGVSEHYRIHDLISGETTTIQGWKILAFDLAHDVPCQGFFIQAPDGEKLLFIGDTSYIRNRFEGINLLAIESNNIEGILSDNIVSGKVPTSLGHRVRRNHLSLERVISMLKANDLSQCRKIFLLHLSDQNSDELRMVRTVQQQTGIPCQACAE
jgi:phosphoribosyl 1,2-cyclic phosphodiesterase